MSPDTAVKVLLAGANLRINIMSPDSMCKAAAAAKKGGAHVTFVGPRSPDTLLTVARIAPGHVTFDTADKN